jgi:hypothetical protein
MSQKIAIGVLILIAVLFAVGLLGGNSNGGSDPTTATWVQKMQSLLPSGKSVTASEMTGSCIQASTITVRVGANCNITIAGNGPTLRTLNLSLPQPPNPAATEDVDIQVIPGDTSSPSIQALLRAANAKEHSAAVNIVKSGAGVTVTCKSAARGTCSVLLQ